MSAKAKAVLLLSALLLGLAGAGGCPKAPSASTTATAPATPTAALLKGVSLSPLSFQPADFTDFFQKAAEAGSVVSWAGDWAELTSATGGPQTLVQLAATYHYAPLVELQFFSQASGALLKPLDEATRRAYRESAAAFAATSKPAYLGLGIEVNLLAEKSPAGFEAFVSLFDEVAGAVKAASPATRVFTVFQLETMKGLGGGLLGGANDPAQAQWALLARFPRADLFAFTTYPGLVYRSPAEIPPDYYLEIRTHTEKPLAFTEIGWHSEAGPPGWESSAAEQAEFVHNFWALTAGLGGEFAVWSFLYDQDVPVPFRSMGLYGWDGAPKPAWQAWLNAG